MKPTKKKEIKKERGEEREGKIMLETRTTNSKPKGAKRRDERDASS